MMAPHLAPPNRDHVTLLRFACDPLRSMLRRQRRRYARSGTQAWLAMDGFIHLPQPGDRDGYRCRPPWGPCWCAVGVKSISLKVPSFVDAAKFFEEVDQVVRGEIVSSGDPVAQYTFCLFQPSLVPQQFSQVPGRISLAIDDPFSPRLLCFFEASLLP